MSPDSTMATDNQGKSRYGIDKLTDDNYYSWAWNCKLLLKEYKVWNVVNGTETRPASPSTGTSKEKETEESAKLREEWDEKDDLALRIISFTVIERLQGPIRLTGTSAKNAWDELEKVHASKNKQRKFNLLRRLFRLDMAPGSSLMDTEREFDALVEGSRSNCVPILSS